jgi:hypothetical protein
MSVQEMSRGEPAVDLYIQTLMISSCCQEKRLRTGHSRHEAVLRVGGEYDGHEALYGEHEDLRKDPRDGERLGAVREEGVEEDEYDAGAEPQRPRPKWQ